MEAAGLVPYDIVAVASTVSYRRHLDDVFAAVHESQ
jgi:hypothetical protein